MNFIGKLHRHCAMLGCYCLIIPIKSYNFPMKNIYKKNESKIQRSEYFEGVDIRKND